MRLTNKQALTAYHAVVEAFTKNKALPINEVNLVSYSMQDLQMRDYVLGHAPMTLGAEGAIEFITQILSLIEEDLRVPFYTLLSAFYYEAGDTELAVASLHTAQTLNPKYTLANLFTRIINAGWSAESLVEMRNELHPKVEATFEVEEELAIA
jgi:tetratricopeptide (TPR) repeat protein